MSITKTRPGLALTRIAIGLAILLGALSVFALPAGVSSQANQSYWIELEPVAGGFELPLQVVDPGDGSGRLFILEKPGTVQIIQNGQPLDTPFLDITDRVQDDNFEEGMLSLVFDPEFATNGFFYLTYTNNDGNWQLDRFDLSSDDPNRADPDSATNLLTIEHRGIEHYGGMMTFGPDGYLWVSVGDGGGKFDPYENGQNPHTLLGTILRLDPSTSSDQAGGDPYAIPPDNPFVDGVGGRPEVWAYGLRNPWRFSFDRATGDLYIADVGQGAWEEVNYVPAGPDGYPEGGLNFGWSEMEGMQCAEVAPDCDPNLYTLPVVQYNHHYGCSVTGGYVERGDPASPVYGDYIFADYCSGAVWIMERDGDDWHAEVRLDTDFAFSSFGEDAAGNIYITDIGGGGVYRVTATNEDPSPVVTSVHPSSIPAGGATCRIDLRGWNFVPEAVVSIGDAPRPTERISEGQLIATLDEEDIASPGALPITVANGEATASESIEIEAGRIGARAIYERWARTDLPVLTGEASRTWMWSPQGLTCPLEEPYIDSPGGTRAVQYFDKSRMEVNDANGDPTSPWYVTNGLLVVELVSGLMQTGDATFEPREPAAINVAGDINDPDAPTYQSFASLLAAPPANEGDAVIQRVDRSGMVTDDPALADRDVRIVTVAGETNHGIAAPFWEFMRSSGPVYEDGAVVDARLFANPYYATGLPITEPYWTTVRVDGTPHEVLVQLFERRVLTYTPDNPEGWQVESGNVGRHYYQWRYGELPFEDAGSS